MTQELSIRKEMAVLPRSADDAANIAARVWEAKLAPDSYKSVEQVALGVMKGMELGVPPMSALQGIAIINNRPCIWGDLAIALCRASGKMKSFSEQIDRSDPKNPIAICTTERTDIAGVIEGTFSWENATRAGLINKAIWKNYPERMLKLRARAFCLRDAFADVLMGLSIVEEQAFIDGGTLVEINPGTFAASEEPDAAETSLAEMARKATEASVEPEDALAEALGWVEMSEDATALWEALEQIEENNELSETEMDQVRQAAANRAATFAAEDDQTEEAAKA